MIKTAAIIHTILALILTATDIIRDNLDLAYCHSVTSILLLINFLGIAFVVQQLFSKKSIALPLLIIILKYPIIFAVIMVLSKQNWMTSVGVFTSALAFLLSLIAAYFYVKVRGQNAF